MAAVTRNHAIKNTVLEIGGPDGFSQLDVVSAFEQTLGSKMKLHFIPLQVLEEQHRSSDPVQKTFAALMPGYAKADFIEGASSMAERYGITLRSVAQYASKVRNRAAVNEN